MSVKFTCLTLTIVSALSMVAFAQSSSRSPKALDGSGTASTGSDQLTKINLNTATSDELRKLPRLGPGSVTAIIESRKKSNFKGWNDFVNRKLVPSFVQKEIRALVAF